MPVSKRQGKRAKMSALFQTLEKRSHTPYLAASGKARLFALEVFGALHLAFDSLDLLFLFGCEFHNLTFMAFAVAKPQCA
jgi:hypothetical protein